MDKHLVTISKFLTLILRHKPETLGISLDTEGWADIHTLLNALNSSGKKISLETLVQIVKGDKKGRFAISSDNAKIRAVQGHSLEVDLSLLPTRPPEILYHGTVERFIESIREHGLLPRNRQFVHLSSDKSTASEVGKRRGPPIILSISSGKMFNDGFDFFLSENKVWLTKQVLPNYIGFPMPKIISNRDFYLAIAELLEQEKTSSRNLEDYLKALWELSREYTNKTELDIDELFNLLKQAFFSSPPEFNESWRDAYNPTSDGKIGFLAWEARIIQQIVDLREMSESKALENKYKYFGTKSPRGQYWYNFDPITYLECATAGSFRGWEPGDSTGRELVPGEAAFIDENGEIKSRKASEIPRRIESLGHVTWEKFEHFLWCGQNYE